MQVNLGTIVNFLTHLRNSDWNGCFCAAPLSLFHYNDPWRESIALENIRAKGWLLAIQMKGFHTSSRKETGGSHRNVTVKNYLSFYMISLCRIFKGQGEDFQFSCWIIEIWCIYQGAFIASVDQVDMRWAIFTRDQTSFQVKQAKNTSPFEL